MPPLVAIVVLNWNGAEDTLRCIASLARQTHPNFRILVVDNGSTDGSPAALRALGDRITLIESTKNLGYTGGNNLGMARAMADGADYVWLFNNDAIAEPDTLKLLVEAAEKDQRIGLLSPALLDPGGKKISNFYGVIYDKILIGFNSTCEEDIYNNWADQCPDKICVYGTAILIRRSVMEKIGYLDDSFFAYYEDYDFSLRSINNGFINIFVNNAKIYHDFKSESKKEYYYYYIARNSILLLRKTANFLKYYRSIIWQIDKEIKNYNSLLGNRPAKFAICQGIFDGLFGIGGEYVPSKTKFMLGFFALNLFNLAIKLNDTIKNRKLNQEAM